ncbi:9906_t:CDS:10 [Cetraspora pellucida]|uniref:9906_t:CDS:1 n=1 Tax=Cetraspora pellucida TaxID=1433469 RepID=A0ACA9LEV5_9GLOM|nr:9906_t:CDS:10 [Cetraspora pellucida]
MAKSGGSALKRLKSTLKEAEVIGHGSRSSMSKKQRRKGKPKGDNKNHVNGKLGFLKDHINPFELKVTKTKHNVIGKKVKGTQGRPGLKRQMGIEKRKKTLLFEMENRNKVGGLIDKRFGEDDPTLSLEEKMLERFVKEKKQRHSKSTIFNLEDDDLTHYGQSLSLIDDFDEPDLLLNDEDDTGTIDHDTVDKGHFGGFEDEQNDDESEPKKKSKAEVMKEVIAKSKMYKHERQLEKDEDERMRNELDNDLDEIRNLISLPKPRADPLPTQEAAFRNTNPKTSDKDDTYDRYVRELALDRRTRPTDRTKSGEEIALEEKEKLEKLEMAQKRRMEGLDPEPDDDSVKSKKQKRASTTDYVDDYTKIYLDLAVLTDYALCRAQENPVPMHLINKLVGRIFDLAQQGPESATEYFVSKVVAMENSLKKKLSSSKLKNSKSMFPTISEFILLRIISQIFPTSDFRHPVVTPALLLMAQYLAQCPFSNGLDLVSGLFLCNLMHEYQILSKRIIPEALNFLFIALVHLAPQDTFNSVESIPGIFPFSGKFVPNLQIKNTVHVDDASPLDFSRLLGVVNKNENNRLDVFDDDAFRSAPAFAELFSPASKIIDAYPLDKFSSAIKTLERLQRFSKKSRKPLELQHHRPIPLPTYTPKFQENFSIDKHYDPDKERANLNKLKAQYKKERKGAIRELRKDSIYIAHHNLKKVKEKDAIYRKRINSIMGILETEQGEKKAYEKAKKYGKI